MDSLLLSLLSYDQPLLPVIEKSIKKKKKKKSIKPYNHTSSLVWVIQN